MNFIKTYDFLLFQETKIDKLDHLNLPNGYSYKAKNRENCIRKSGGTIIIYKNKLAKFLEFPESNSSFVQWVRIKNIFLETEKSVLLGCLYVHPENTKYSSPDAFEEIETEMFQFAKECDYIGILGDSNAKTGI